MQKKGKKFKRSVADEVSADTDRPRPRQGGAIGGQPQATNPNSSVAVTVKGRRFRRAAESKSKEELKKQEQQQQEQQQQKQQQLEQQQEEELVQEEECYEVPEVHCTYRRPRGGYYSGEDEVDGLFSRFDDRGRSRYAQPGGRFVAQDRDRNSYRDYDRYELSESLQLLKAGGERGRLRQAKVGDRFRNSDLYRYPESFEDSDGESIDENPSRYRDGKNEKSARNRWTNDRDLLRGYPERTVAVEDFNDFGEGSWLAELAGGLESMRTSGLYRTRTGSRAGAAADAAKLSSGRSAGSVEKVRVDPVLRRFASSKLVSSGGPSNINSFGEENDDVDTGEFVEGRSIPRWTDSEREDAGYVKREHRGRANPRFRRYAAEGPEERYCETKLKVVCSKSEQQQPAEGRVRARRDLGEKIGKFFPALRICDILVRIRIRGSVPLINKSGSNFGSDSFLWGLIFFFLVTYPQAHYILVLKM